MSTSRCLALLCNVIIIIIIIIIISSSSSCPSSPSGVLQSGSTIMMQMLFFLLYSTFMLCDPLHINFSTGEGAAYMGTRGYFIWSLCRVIGDSILPDPGCQTPLKNTDR